MSNTKLHKEYRKDWRSDEEYAEDIKKGHITERQIVHTYAEHVRLKYKSKLIIEDNGVNNNGEVIEESEVNTKADYKINGFLVEVKFINDKTDMFRLKKSQVLSYIKQNATILMVNGWETDHPQFTMITPERLKEIVKTRRAKPFKTWGYKKCYFLKTYLFNWTEFACDKVIDK